METSDYLSFRITLPQKRFNLETMSGQAALIHALILHFGGPTKFAEVVRDTLKHYTIDRSVVVNWRKRDGIAAKDIFKLAYAWNCSPFALNYKRAVAMFGLQMSWEEAVDSCTILSEETRAKILKRKAPVVKPVVLQQLRLAKRKARKKALIEPEN